MDENATQKTSLKQVLRKYSQFEVAFPLNKRLMDNLRGDVLWFTHSQQNCKIADFYKREGAFKPIKTLSAEELVKELVVGKDEEPAQQAKKCSNCDKAAKDLKVCSRCR